MRDSEPPKLDTSQSEERWHRFTKLPKPFQFSLRTLLIVVVLVSIALIWPAIKIHQARRERVRNEQVAAIKAQWWEYGAVDVSVDQQGNVVLATGREGADELLERLKGQTKLRVLDLRWSDVSDDGLEHLNELTSLQELILSDSREFTDSGLEHLKGLPNLQNLALDHTEITDAGLVHLSSVPRLERLGLCYTRISDNGLPHLSGVTKLQILTLPGSITDAGLMHLNRLSSLRLVTVPKTHVTDEGIKNLHEALPNCEIYYKPLPSKE
jgi:hypothetical protein